MTKELKEVATDKSAAEQLKIYIQTIEAREGEKKEIAERIKEVFDEAKAMGFDTKTMKTIIKLRKRSDEELSEEEYLLTTYKEALGMGDE